MGKFFVLYWFDTEDYVTPETDDALLRIAQILTRTGIRATFKLVGEKLRQMERRGRQDVIEALRCHDIGYHTDLHSQPPTVPAYLEGWEMDDGAEEFLWREGRGIADIQRVFKRPPSCYGQPGGAWAPQAHLAMRRIGMPVYLGEGSYVGIPAQQPYWLMGVLSISRLGWEHEAVLNLQTNDLDEAKQRFLDIKSRVGEGAALVNSQWHECELVCPEFWDAVNYTRGQYRPPAHWEPARLYSPEEQEARFRNFEAQAQWLAAQPDVQFITANEAATLFPDRAVGRLFSREELSVIAKALAVRLHWIDIAGTFVSAAEGLCMLCDWAIGAADRPLRNQYHLVLGPDIRIKTKSIAKNVSWDDLKSGARKLLDAALYSERLPGVVPVTGIDIPLADFAKSFAKAVSIALTGQIPDTTQLEPAQLATDEYVKNAPGSVGWIPFPEGLLIDQQIEITKAQTWTLKPAQLWVA